MYKANSDPYPLPEGQLLAWVNSQPGMTYTFSKQEERFIHTFLGGQLAIRLGLEPEQVIGRALEQFVPDTLAKSLLPNYELAWSGKSALFVAELNGIYFQAALQPVFIDGEVVQVTATAVETQSRPSASAAPERELPKSGVFISGEHAIHEAETEKLFTEEMIRRSDKLSALGQMAAGIAHEIRNPLTALKGFVQLLKSQSPNHPIYFEIMLSELERINFIVTEFMRMAKPQTESFQHRDLAVITENIVSFMSAQAILYNIEIKMVLEPSLPLIYCDENQLKQVFINVLKNAIEAMSGGGVIEFRIKRQPGAKLKIEISDQGPGIPEDQIALLGSPFFTTKEGGTGLGLMVSYQIIENHNGKLYITSEAHSGATVHIELPE